MHARGLRALSSKEPAGVGGCMWVVPVGLAQIRESSRGGIAPAQGTYVGSHKASPRWFIASCEEVS